MLFYDSITFNFVLKMFCVECKISLVLIVELDFYLNKIMSEKELLTVSKFLPTVQ